MRISTSQMFQHSVNGLLNQQSRIAKLQEQIASGLRVRTPSDDPIASAQIELLLQRISNTESLQHNIGAANDKLRFEESILSGSISSLQRLRDIQIQAGNGALSDSDRKSLAIEATGLLNQLQGDANSKDHDGYYMFSGGRVTAPAVSLNASGQYVYNGDSTQRFQAITDSSQVAINDTGDSIFMRVPNGNGLFAINQTATPNAGTAALSSGSVSNSAAYVADNYTVSFALNSDGKVVYMVNGAASGQMVPPSGLADDAPLYQDGDTVGFNGVEFIITGMPEAGDSFFITPSQNESIFSTVQSMINTLNQPQSTPAEKASAQTQNNQLLEQLDSALNSVINAQSNIGNRLNQLERAENSNGDLILFSKDTLKNIREVDETSVITELTQQMINLQAAQQSFVRIQALSVFNYI